ncbi:MAG TPA: MBL fold metallo-hydrolase [Fibrobacteria bacterium]|nr:MBL fold metallo-hydrolase [Fibrobacteria bacterium]
MSVEWKWRSEPSGMLGCVGTMVWNTRTSEAVLIDPTDDASTFLDLFEDQGLKLVEILLTHAHFDHCADACRVAKSHGVPLRLHRDDWPLFQQLPDWGANFGMRVPAPDVSPMHVDHGETLSVAGGLSVKVLHTPGHTPGQVAYFMESLGLVVVGDTLFQGSVGRTDFPGGSFPQLERSIRTHLYTLPEGTVVVPGHGDTTTIGDEKRHNAYVRP